MRRRIRELARRVGLRADARRSVVVAALAVITTAAVVAVVACTASPAAPRHSAGPDFGTAPAYTLTDQNDRAFASSALHGKVQIVSYLFPYCTSFCPLLTGAIARAQTILDRDRLGARVAFVAFNVDPAHAGPDTLAAFLRQEHIDPHDPSWHFLTGTPAAVRHVVTDGYHVFYQQISIAEEERIAAEQQAAGGFLAQPTAPNPMAERAHVDYDITHNDVVEIVDPGGTIRTILSGNAVPTPEQIVAAVRNALAMSGR